MNEIKQISDEDYFKSKGISNSWLKLFDISPMHAKYYKRTTKSMELGSIIHDYLFDDNIFDRNYVLAPEMYKDEKLGEILPLLNRKNKPYPSFEKDNPDKTIILQHEFKDLQQIKTNLLNYKIYDNMTFKYIYKNSQKEIAVYWTSIIDDVEVQKKCKPDILFQDDKYNIIIDYKSMTNCLDFWYQNKRMQYYRQDAWYSEGIEQITGNPTIFIFLTFETTAPFGVMARVLDDYWKHEGKIANLQSTLNYVKWLKEDRPEKSYSEGIHEVTEFRQDCL